MVRYVEWSFAGLMVVLATGCGQLRPFQLQWPALAVLDGLETTHQDRLLPKIEEFNANLEEPILVVGNTHGGSPIEIRVVEGFETKSLAPVGMGEFAFLRLPGTRGVVASRIAGRATLRNQACKIELAEFLLAPHARDLLLSVFWHEIGHCAGLGHVDETGELMSSVSFPFSSYDESQVKRFFTSVWQSVWGSPE